jgi:hypothetical protein
MVRSRIVKPAPLLKQRACRSQLKRGWFEVLLLWKQVGVAECRNEHLVNVCLCGEPGGGWNPQDGVVGFGKGVPLSASGDELSNT